MIEVEVIGGSPLSISIDDNGDVGIEVIAENSFDIDINSTSTILGGLSGSPSQTIGDFIVTGNIYMDPGDNQIISFTGGTRIYETGIGIPYNRDFYIASADNGNGNVHIGKTSEGTVAVKNDFSVTGVATFSDYAYFAEDLGTTLFFSGFAGSGWKLDHDTDYTLTVDNLFVRKALTVYELIINQIRATNGSLWVSDAAKVDHVVGTTCYIDTDNDSIVQPFVVDDIVRCQKWTGRGIKYYSAQVTAVDAGGEYFTLLVIDGTDAPEKGDTIVRVGNATDTSRQGALYLTSNDSGSPYMDILDGVTSYTFTGKQKVRLGKLTGITDADFGGQLTGYGLYATNVYLKGSIVISEGSSGYDNLTDKPDLADYYLATEVDALLSDLQDQLDGQITTYFYDYAPTLSNVPASDWTTDLLKDDHLGDLFYNTTTGYGYRFSKISGVYSWQLLSDQDVAEALAAAAAAQDTADHKRRVFVATPTPPYDIGDLWVTGTDLYRCSTAKTEGQSYASGDWILATTYTEGATWGTDLNNIPSTLGTPSGTGLFLSATHMGFYNNGGWKTYIDNSGNFILGDIAGGNTGLSWNQGSGVLNIKGVVNITSGSAGYANITDRPTSLSGINSTEGSKLAGVAAGATVGATWGSNLYNIPATLSAPSGNGLYLSSTYMGYYNSGAWKTYIDNTGNLVLGNISGGGTGLSWNQGTAVLTVRGTMYVASGQIGGWTIDTNAIYATAKSTADGYASSGFTLASNGGIHTPRFYLNSNGSIGIRSSASGKRLEIDSINNRIDLYNSSGYNVIRINDAWDDDWPNPGVFLLSPSGGNQRLFLTNNKAELYQSTSILFSMYVSTSYLYLVAKGLPYASSGTPSGLASGQIWRDANNNLRIYVP